MCVCNRTLDLSTSDAMLEAHSEHKTQSAGPLPKQEQRPNPSHTQSTVSGKSLNLRNSPFGFCRSASCQLKCDNQGVSFVHKKMKGCEAQSCMTWARACAAAGCNKDFLFDFQSVCFFLTFRVSVWWSLLGLPRSKCGLLKGKSMFGVTACAYNLALESPSTTYNLTSS